MVSLFGFGSSSSPAAKTTVENPEKSAKAVNPLNPDGIKPCCACPLTKKKRDECFFNTPPEEADLKCADYIQAHRECMAGFGFKI